MKTISLKYYVLGTFAVSALIVASIAILVHYFSSMNLAKQAAEQQFESIADMVNQRAQISENLGNSYVAILSKSPYISETVSPDQSHSIVDLMASAMETSPYITAMFVAYPNGDLIQLTNLEAANGLRAEFSAAPEDRWIESRNVAGRYIARFADGKLNTRVFLDTQTDYDPRVRPWYTMANTESVVKTPPFLSFGNSLLVAYVKRMENGEVVGVSFSLSYLSALLEGNILSKGSQAFLFDYEGKVTQYGEKREKQTVAATRITNLNAVEQAYLDSKPTITVGNLQNYPPFDFSVSGKPKGYSIEFMEAMASYAGLNLRYVNGAEFTELMQLFYAGEIDVMTSIFKNEEREKLGLFSEPIYDNDMRIISNTGNLENYRNLAQLAGKKIALPEGYIINDYMQERFPDYQYTTYESPIETLAAVSSGEADITIELNVIAEYIERYYFLDNLKFSPAIAELSETPQFQMHLFMQKRNAVLHSILLKAQEQIGEQTIQALTKQWLEDTSEGDVEEKVAKGALPSDILITIARDNSKHRQVFETEISGKRYFTRVDPIGENIDFDNQDYLGVFLSEKEILEPFLDNVYLAIIISVGGFIIVVPLVFYLALRVVTPIHKVIEQSELISDAKFSDIKQVKTGIKELDKLSYSIAEMANKIGTQSQVQNDLIDAFVMLIGKTIKRRMGAEAVMARALPDVAVNLAQISEKNQLFAFDSEKNWREFKIAGWLYHCGRVATPEHIVGKRTKLETMYNRIHEVRTRFEVLARDAEIAKLKDLAKMPEAKDAIEEQHKARITALHDDFAFVAKCNLGDTHLSENDLSRLKTIGQQRWVRTFDNRLGLSQSELDRMQASPKSGLETQSLLMDNPEHIEYRKRQSSGQEIYGYQLIAPQYQQNLGEIYNLSISEGIHNTEERFMIDEQHLHTLTTLNSLNLPDEMDSVPEYISAQYLYRLRDKRNTTEVLESQSTPAKILGIADVFVELMTTEHGEDKNQRLNQVLAEMEQMAEQGLIDKVLLSLFIDTRAMHQCADIISATLMQRAK